MGSNRRDSVNFSFYICHVSYSNRNKMASICFGIKARTKNSICKHLWLHVIDRTGTKDDDWCSGRGEIFWLNIFNETLALCAYKARTVAVFVLKIKKLESYLARLSSNLQLVFLLSPSHRARLWLAILGPIKLRRALPIQCLISLFSSKCCWNFFAKCMYPRFGSCQTSHTLKRQLLYLQPCLAPMDMENINRDCTFEYVTDFSLWNPSHPKKCRRKVAPETKTCKSISGSPALTRPNFFSYETPISNLKVKMKKFR